VAALMALPEDGARQAGEKTGGFCHAMRQSRRLAVLVFRLHAASSAVAKSLPTLLAVFF
jgi:hypothetical protein